MIHKTFRTAAVIVPPRECWAPIQNIREEFDCNVWRLMPHITLLFPFLPRVKFPEIENTIKPVLQDIPPCDIRLDRFCEFHHGMEQYTLWLAPEPAAPIVRIQNLLTSLYPKCCETSDYASGFTPHLTVAQVDGEKKKRQLKAKLQLSWKTLSFQLKEIMFIYRGRTPDDIFRVDRPVGLG